ncbi:hypothetical protein T4D_2382 [Trichinella pseudospiralis]|uniref:Uncharacterized protein n=1 Tax=Trichinella pseudospiralis TaxID=6337 RepID=A0A0V1F8B5_TRIPS|nr:hypothetical protein T4D_2382 [Trichinella pseudospiralis]
METKTYCRLYVSINIYLPFVWDIAILLHGLNLWTKLELYSNSAGFYGERTKCVKQKRLENKSEELKNKGPCTTKMCEEIPPPLYKSQERPITGQQLVQCVYTAY